MKTVDPEMTTHKAKKIIKARLEELELPYDKLTSKTIDFTDLARCSVVFVTIHGWTPHPAANDLENLAVENGFRVDFCGAGVICS